MQKTVKSFLNCVIRDGCQDWCWLKDRGELTLRHLYQCGPNEVREAKKAQEIMKILEDHGWAQKLDDRKNSWAIRKQ